MEQQIVLSSIRLDELVTQLTESIATKVAESIAEKHRLSESEKLISTTEVCNLFVPKISRQTLGNWVKKGLLEKKPMGGRVFFSQNQVLNAAKILKKYKRG